jgi:hypothetical protein
MKEYPFLEEKIDENVYIRTFHNDTTSEELIWHRDREDRIIEAIGNSDWLIQLDNELPKKITEPVFIPNGVYHRLIKGNGDLRLKLQKIIS